MWRKQFQIGDLVRIRLSLISSEDFVLIGIVLKVDPWDRHLTDVLVHWTDNKRSWCTGTALEKLL